MLPLHGIVRSLVVSQRLIEVGPSSGGSVRAISGPPSH